MIWTPPYLDGALPHTSEEMTTTKVTWPQTATQQTSGPVFKLNVDLLYRIFWMNADMDEECEGVKPTEDLYRFRALITTRNASQVCHRWREIILSSSSLWAKAIDLQLLDQESDHWREEVIRRTGTAFLHLKGKVRGHHREVREFFERLIVDHWNRIRFLDIDIYHPKTFKSETWAVLTRPAPILQSLKLRFHPRTLFPTSLPHGPIFDNIAPSLREFYVEQLQFDPQSIWFSQIRKFGLFPTPNSPFTASQILEVISHMPLLESLSLGNAFPDETPDRLDAFQSIRLLRLSEIIVSEMELRVCVTILGKITPGPDCVLDIFCAQRLNRGFESASCAEDAQAKVVLTRYFNAFFDTRTVSTLSLRRFCGVFTLEDDISSFENQVHSRRRRRFRVSVDHYNPSLLFDIFSSCQYSDVKTLELCLDKSDSTKPLPSITTFLQRFPSVNSLSIDRFALHHLNNVPQDVTLFPSLREIRMKGRIFLRENPTTRPYDTLGTFLRRSFEAGAPIKTVNLTASNFRGEDLKGLGDQYSKEFGVVKLYLT